MDHDAVQHQWRAMAAADLAPVHHLANRIHVDYPERLAVLTQKFDLFGRGCFVLDSADGRIDGYCLSHPWIMGDAPKLDIFFDALPDHHSTYFIHDLTIAPAQRGRRQASRLISALIEICEDLSLRHMTLIAVNGSQPFWVRMGFCDCPDPIAQQSARTSYGVSAVAMERILERDAARERI